MQVLEKILIFNILRFVLQSRFNNVIINRSIWGFVHCQTNARFIIPMILENLTLF